jgi:hypothetical protein
MGVPASGHLGTLPTKASQVVLTAYISTQFLQASTLTG